MKAKQAAADLLVWLCMIVIAVGFIGGLGISAYLQWGEGFDSGAPFSFFAGIRMLKFMFENPLVLVLFAVGAMGAIGLALMAPHTSARRRTLSRDSFGDEQLRRQIDAAQSLTTAYSRILQAPRGHFWPLSTLNVDKKTIKVALKADAAYQASQGTLDGPVEGGTTTLRDGYIFSYATLADFVQDDVAARVNRYHEFIKSQGDRVRSGEPIDAMASAEALAKLAPSKDDERASQQARDEWVALADEMTAYLDKIAPRQK
jgi:hypothetical protein